MSIIKEEFERIVSRVEESKHFRALDNLKKELNQRPFVLYGYGQICKTIIDLCERMDIKIEALCDSNKKSSDEGSEFTIISPEMLRYKYPDAYIMITSKRFENEIAKRLQKMGFHDYQIYPFPLSHEFVMHPEFFKEKHIKGFIQAYDFFKDDVSRGIIIDRMRMHLLGATLTKTSTGPIYFEPNIFSLSQNEVFVDGGCFKGETAIEFIRQTECLTSGGYYYVYSFEPDIPIFEIADKNLRKYSNVNCIAKGLWSSETELSFCSDGGNGGSSCVIGRPSISVPVTYLDKFFEGKSDKELPTFIKMDIEGAEKEALMGAKSIIKKKHPKLAICVYHKPEDIYEIPKLINEIDSGYKFIMHQYEDGIYDTVLYAV